MRPGAPVVGVGGVLIHGGKVLLIRRGKPPLYGRWVVPGGTVELGEPLEQALVREMLEETGLVVEPVELLTVFDRIEREGERVVYHYVIVDYLCRLVSGEARAASDALDVAWAAPSELAGYDLPPKALEVVQDGLPAGGESVNPAPLRASFAIPQGKVYPVAGAPLCGGPRRLVMKRLALAVVGMTALAVAAEAGSPFEPAHLVYKVRVYTLHALRARPREGQQPRQQPVDHRRRARPSRKSPPRSRRRSRPAPTDASGGTGGAQPRKLVQSAWPDPATHEIVSLQGVAVRRTVRSDHSLGTPHGLVNDPAQSL